MSGTPLSGLHNGHVWFSKKRFPVGEVKSADSSSKDHYCQSDSSYAS